MTTDPYAQDGESRNQALTRLWDLHSLAEGEQGNVRGFNDNRGDVCTIDMRQGDRR